MKSFVTLSFIHLSCIVNLLFAYHANNPECTEVLFILVSIKQFPIFYYINVLLLCGFNTNKQIRQKQYGKNKERSIINSKTVTVTEKRSPKSKKEI